MTDPGIGLALTRAVCRRHGGEMAVINTTDGAMFTARLTVRHPGAVRTARMPEGGTATLTGER